MQEERTKYAIAIPNLGSLILTHSTNGSVKGLKDFAPEDRPNSTVVLEFPYHGWFRHVDAITSIYRSMVEKNRKLFESKWFHRFALLMGPSGFIALLAGWFTTEVGRQPWVVYGVMRTKDALSLFQRSKWV